MTDLFELNSFQLCTSLYERDCNEQVCGKFARVIELLR